MYSLLYFDTEDHFSPPDSPVHQLPGQMAEIMTKHGLVGCFHIHGEKVRFMERRGQTNVIEAIKKHDVSLHYDRGSIHPTTAEEVSNLDWFRGVDRVLFRELPGFQTFHRAFGKCSGLTQHGGTFAAQIVYAAGKMGYPMLYSPFQLPGRGVSWYCGNLLMAGSGGYDAPSFDRIYRDTPRFEEGLAKVDDYLHRRARDVDYWACFGCHPVNTMMEAFPDVVNFSDGASPTRKEWKAPTAVADVSIPVLLGNFERYIEKLVAHPDVTWTTVSGISELYGQRPVTVSDGLVMEAAEAVFDNRGPTFTSALTAGELLYLLALRALDAATAYEVPQVMGPPDGDPDGPDTLPNRADVTRISHEILEGVIGSSYLPARLGGGSNGIGPSSALVLLACHALNRSSSDISNWNLGVDAIPDVPGATERVKEYKNWAPHGPQYNQPEIVKHFRLQAWTLKPALRPKEYPAGVELGRHANAMIA